MRAAAVGYWVAFWLLNGLDKFLNRSEIFGFIWYGKDRVPQFTDYFRHFGISDALVAPLVVAIGVWEFAVAALLATSFVTVASRSTLLRSVGFFLSAFTFIGFSIFDIISGDRAELREHCAYLVLVFVSWYLASIRRCDRSAAGC